MKIKIIDTWEIYTTYQKQADLMWLKNFNKRNWIEIENWEAYEVKWVADNIERKWFKIFWITKKWEDFLIWEEWIAKFWELLLWFSNSDIEKIIVYFLTHCQRKKVITDFRMKKIEEEIINFIDIDKQLIPKNQKNDSWNKK